MVLYLDFDGVLHDCEVWWSPDRGAYLDVPGRNLFEWAPLLERLLAPHREVKIILSTTWVLRVGFDRAKDLLPAGLQGKVIGATFIAGRDREEEFQLMTRAQQILTDVQRRQLVEWFAVDDDDFGWPAHCRGRLIKTRGGYGLSDMAIQESITKRLSPPVSASL